MAVSVRGLTRHFGSPGNPGAPVLDRLDLDIGRGEFVALLGRSGSGKTTLLRTLAGLDPVSEGNVVVPPKRSVVFQEPRLLPWKRVRDNVRLGLVGADVDRLVESALREVELSHRMDAWPLTLSGGEAQRAGLARALVRDPELLLLDEPFAALDALTRLRMQRLVGELCRRHQPAVLLVTHDVDEAVLLADRVLVLQQGRIAVERPLTMTRPRNPAHVTFAAVKRDLLQSLGVET